MEKRSLLGRLKESVTENEWAQLIEKRELAISTFNRTVMLELLSSDSDCEGEVDEKEVRGLTETIENYLGEYLTDRKEAWKWIELSSLYLTFIAGRPMHPIEQLDIKVIQMENGVEYECPCKTSDPNTTCHYCVCRRMSNYEITKRKMCKEFLKYDQNSMIRKLRLKADEEAMYVTLYHRDCRIDRKTGRITCQEQEAGYEEAMTIYDILCYSKDYCQPSGVSVTMNSLSGIKGGSAAVGNRFFKKQEEFFDRNTEAFLEVCESLNGKREGKGDVSYRIPMFQGLDVTLQFWNSDEEFPASLQILVDQKLLDYMHYETMWFAVSHLIRTIEGIIKEKIHE